MTQRLDLYKCNTCGQLIEVILPGDGELVCCGHPMEYLEAKTQEAEMGEKHVPVYVTNAENGDEIRVGETLHPMTEEHYIQFIESISEGSHRADLQYFSPYDEPIMLLKDRIGEKKARAYCNIHGLWSSPDGE